MAGQGPTKLPPGILPPGINLPQGTDIMQFCRDLAESGAEFSEQFERDNPKFHNGNTTPVPLGGGKIPESMKTGPETLEWRDMPDAPLAIENDFGPAYNKAMAEHSRLNQCKKAISVLNKPVEIVMKLRVQYKGATGDDDTAWRGRLKGAEVERDGAIAAALVTIETMDDAVVSERTRACVKDVETRGKFNFVDKETFGEYMQVLQRANQAIFMDQTRLLAKIKELKKAAKGGQAPAPAAAVDASKEKENTEANAKGGGYVAQKVPAALEPTAPAA